MFNLLNIYDDMIVKTLDYNVPSCFFLVKSLF